MIRIQGKTRQAGFSIISAIFLVVILSMLAAFMVSISSVQHTTAALGARSARAYYAARAGLTWATYQAEKDTGCGNVDGKSFTINDPGSTLNGFRVSTACTMTDHQVQNQTLHFVVLSATASAGTWGSGDFVSRRMRAKLTLP